MMRLPDIMLRFRTEKISVNPRGLDTNKAAKFDAAVLTLAICWKAGQYPHAGRQQDLAAAMMMMKLLVVTAQALRCRRRWYPQLISLLNAARSAVP